MDTKDNLIAQVSKPTRADLHGAINQTAEKAQPLIDHLATSAHQGVDKMSDTIDEVSGTLATGSKKLAAACETGRDYVRRTPVVSLLVAAAVGYGLSKLRSSRK